MISSLDKSEYLRVIEVWESAVRATHHFLSEEDIAYFKPLILNTYLDAVVLRCVRNDKGQIVGFSGVAEENLEMLFIHADHRGKGIGRVLLDHAIKVQGVQNVDVNEDNKQAIGFYQKYGFVTYKRSEKDASGKPFPILHMRLIS